MKSRTTLTFKDREKIEIFHKEGKGNSWTG
jgi:hypothetical protein